MNETQSKKPTEKSGATGEESESFTEEERAAMKERAKEAKAEKRRGKGPAKADGESDVMAKIAEMDDADRAIAEELHALVKATAPDLTSRTWYGMPAYAKDGKVVLFFQAAQKFKSRYATLGFSDRANLDEGDMWPSAFALKAWTSDVEKRVGELVAKALG